MSRAMTEAQEKSLRLRLGFLCMAAVVGKEDDLERCTEGVLDYVSELIKPYSTNARPQQRGVEK